MQTSVGANHPHMKKAQENVKLFHLNMLKKKGSGGHEAGNKLFLFHRGAAVRFSSCLLDWEEETLL